MEKISITVEKRQELGKGKTKKLRESDLVPAVVYGHDTNTPLLVDREAFKVLRSIHFSESAIINMHIKEGKTSAEPLPVLVKDVQFHPLTEEVIHIDFLKVSLKEKIKVHLPIVLKGEAKGAKEGGTLSQTLREVEIEALPLDIPEDIELDVSELKIGDSIHVSALSLPENVKIITEPEETIVVVSAHKEEPEIEEPEVAEETEAGEPEVIKEKKEEGEEGEKAKGEEKGAGEDKK